MPSDIKRIIAVLSVPEVTVQSEKDIKTWAGWLGEWNDREMVYDRDGLDDWEIAVLGLLFKDEHASEDNLLVAADILLSYRSVLEEYAKAENILSKKWNQSQDRYHGIVRGKEVTN